MITSRFPLGDVSFSAEYFSTLVGEATKQCYGVAAMTPRDLTDVVKSVVRGNDYSEKGVRVTQEEGRLVIELHIAVSYGLNISTAARSISHRVKDEVEQATGLMSAKARMMEEKAENILNSFDGISNVTCVSSENDSYDFEFDNAMAAEEKKKLFFAFAENEIPILMQKEIEPSLEDIFLKLTDNTTEKEENTNESDI